jgi:hypothetical protein
MKIGPSGFCMPVSSGCTVLKREAVLKVPQPFRRAYHHRHNS